MEKKFAEGLQQLAQLKQQDNLMTKLQRKMDELEIIWKDIQMIIGQIKQVPPEEIKNQVKDFYIKSENGDLTQQDIDDFWGLDKNKE